MACFLKLPAGGHKGIVTFTTAEWSFFIAQSSVLHELLTEARKHWVFGLHHNSSHANHDFVPDPLFDFHLAGPGDLKSRGGAPFKYIELDCSNFCPDYFEDTRAEKSKFWDVLFVSRNVAFKNLDDLFPIVRRMLDVRPVRVLAIVSHEGLHVEGGARSSSAISRYLRDFSPAERRLFTLMTPSIDYPFSYDLRTLAHFYHHSRTFLHVATEERHPRVVAYAWAAGLPVVAPPQVGSLLPAELKKPPGFFAYDNLSKAAESLLSAIDAGIPAPLAGAYRDHHLHAKMVGRLKAELTQVAGPGGGEWILNDLDIRLARHHDGVDTTNTLPMDLAAFGELLKAPERLPAFAQSPDYERVACGARTATGGGKSAEVAAQIRRATLKSKLSLRTLAASIKPMVKRLLGA